MIAKITRGQRVGDIAAYLHGPGKSDEHYYVKDKRRHAGGMVIASNIGVEGATDPGEWTADLRQAQSRRPDINKPIWQASLRLAPEDRLVDDREWADIASRFMDAMGVGEHPWVAVRHGKDHVHVVVSRVSDIGNVWHGRNDRRVAQRACTELEQRHGFVQAPRRKTQARRPVVEQRERWREKSQSITEDRSVPAEQRELRRRVQQLTREQWAGLTPEGREVIQVTAPERVPGARVRPRGASPAKSSSPTASVNRRPVRERKTESRRDHGR